MRMAHGAEGFEDFGDVGGFGAGETFGDCLRSDGVLVRIEGDADALTRSAMVLGHFSLR